MTELVPTPPSDIELDRYLPYQLLVATSGITQHTTGIYASELGITIAEARVVMVVHAFGPLSTYEIADLTKMDKAKISRAIKQFTATGILSRKSNPQDKRLITLTLTPKGKLLRRRLADIMIDIEHRVFACITPDEKSELARILKKIVASQ